MTTENPFLYCTVGEIQRKFGFYVTGAGTELTKPGEPYPHAYHSSEYYFTWEKGRKLVKDEYQILYILSGEGVIEFKRNAPIKLSAGSVVILHPGEWHRYRPNPKTGWKEAYIGIGGESVGRILAAPFFDGPPTVFAVQPKGKFENDLLTLVENIKLNATSKPYSLSLRVMALAGTLIETIHQSEDNQIDYSTIRKVHLFIGHHLGEVVDFAALSAHYKMSYSLFRKHFREYTGMAPLEYQLALRIRRASALLANSTVPIAQIATDTGFRTPAYFARYFHEATGQSPSEFRASHQS